MNNYYIINENCKILGDMLLCQESTEFTIFRLLNILIIGGSLLLFLYLYTKKK